MKVINEPLKDDLFKETRQIGMIDINGNTEAFTGKQHIKWKGHVTGKDVIVIGNILKSEEA